MPDFRQYLYSAHRLPPVPVDSPLFEAMLFNSACYETADVFMRAAAEELGRPSILRTFLLTVDDTGILITVDDADNVTVLSLNHDDPLGAVKAFLTT